MKKLIGRRGIFKKIRRISEITGFITLILIAVLAGDIFYIASAGDFRLEPMIAMIVGVAFLYFILMLLGWAERILKK